MLTMQRPCLRYPGGKFISAKTIISLFPDHQCYVEPFGGGGSVLLQKEFSQIEVFNDLDGEIVNFFRVLRDRENELIRAIELTPYSRLENKLAHEPSEDPLESARRLYVRLWQGYGGTTKMVNKGWRYISRSGHDLVGNWNDIDRLYAIASRLKQVQIECDSYEKILNRYDSPETLFFLDPPYVHDTRSNNKGIYQFEFTDEQHKDLIDAITALKGKAILCGYENNIYNPLIDNGWETITYQGKTNGGGNKTEVLWISPNSTRNRQLSLFF